MYYTYYLNFTGIYVIANFKRRNHLWESVYPEEANITYR